MAELLRPGVEVLQAARTPAPTFVRPTLVPCVVGPAFEVINVLNTDGTINSKAKYGAYTQIGKTITQSAFPDPRQNVDELDILEASVRPFLLSSGSLSELLMNPGESFLTTSHGASKAAITTDVFGGPTGLALVGKVLVLSIDNPVPANTANDVIITFTGTGSNLTAAEAAEQINDAVGQNIATIVGTAPNDAIRLTTTKAGAKSSITVRAGGSANTLLEIGFSSGSPAHEERVVGSGYRAEDDNDNDTMSPWIEFFQGGYFLDGADTAFDPKAGLINVETNQFVSAKASAVTFGDGNTVPVKVGDVMIGDGLKVKNAEIMKVEASRIRLGTINTLLSTADSNGNYTTKVYDSVEVETLFDGAPFAPQFVYFRATGLVPANLAPVAATVLGSVTGAAATSGVAMTGVVTTPAALAGLKIHYVSTINGVETEGEFTFTGGPFANAAAIAAAIGTNIPGVTATDVTGKVHFTTIATGRLQSINIKADGTANGALNLSTSSDTIGTGTDVEFKDIPARVIGTGAQTFPFATTLGETLQIEYSTDGGSTYGGLRTFTFPSTGNQANITALLGVLNTAANWDGGTLPTTFTISADGNTLQLVTTASGGQIGLRVRGTSTAIGPTAGSDLLFTASQGDVGEEELNGQTLVFALDKNPHLYSVTFSSNSLDLAIADINAVVGATVAAKAGAGQDQLRLTSVLKGSASQMLVTAGPAATAFGLSTTATGGSGRPLPDAYLDSVNNLVVGSQILRDQVTGYPLDFLTNLSDLYIQFKALRKDVSAAAQVAGVLRITDQATLAEVLDPITDENPLALGLFLCLINAPGLEVKALGVDEISAAAPQGTEAAYARAAGFLEAEEIYAMAPLTQNEVVIGMFSSHVTAMSEPQEGGERIAFVNKVMPVRRNPVIAASGTQSNSTATTNQMLLDVNPAAGLVAAGVNPALPMTPEMGVYMEFDVGGELRRYNVANVSGSLVNFNVTFTGSQNSDAFYTTTPRTETVLNSAWSLKVRGTSIMVPGSNPPRLDYGLVAETVAAANEGYKNRRLFSVFPDAIKTTVAGVEKSLPGYYACAAITGMVASQPPQQGFTNFPIAGLTGVVGTEKFTKRQLNEMAGGGTYILIQDVQGGPVTSRHQVSTDTSIIEYRELSITKIVDFVAKFLRASVRKFIGVQVINDQFLDTIGTTIQGILSFLIETGVLNGAEVNNILQDEDNPDTVLVDITLDVPYPANYIKITLVV